MELDLHRVYATDLILEAVDHALGEVKCEEKLKKELKLWKTIGEGGGEGSDYCQQEGFISFDLLIKLHHQLQKTPLGV